LSGGYEDDEDHGDVIVYTGYGGRDPATGKQISDQPFSLWNRALAYSSLNGLPVRVIRGPATTRLIRPALGTAMTVCIRWTTTGALVPWRVLRRDLALGVGVYRSTLHAPSS
jgi:hypothetical protein